jgi:hypothetical protein
MNINSEYTSIRNLDSYTKDQIKNMELISFKKDELPEPYGSVAYRAQRYPADIDLFQKFESSGTMFEVINQFEKELIRVTKNIMRSKNHYLSEFKAGLDIRYEIDLTGFNNGFFLVDHKKLMRHVDDLYYQRLFTDTERCTIMNVLNSNMSGNDKYDVVNFVFRNRRILRWTPKEILQRFKILPLNKIITLNEALAIKTHIKIDTIVLTNQNKYIEITNFVALYYTDENGDKQIVNFDDDIFKNKYVKSSFKESISDDIEKLYYSNMYYNPFKCIKRMWSYARYYKLAAHLNNLTRIISGNTSHLYQLKSQLAAMITILENHKKDKNIMKNINNQIDDFKSVIIHVIDISNEQVNNINKYIDNIMHENNVNDKLELMYDFSTLLKMYIETFTIRSLDKISYNPPPLDFLPINRHYNGPARREHEHPINPLDIILSEYCGEESPRHVEIVPPIEEAKFKAPEQTSYFTVGENLYKYEPEFHGVHPGKSDFETKPKSFYQYRYEE